MSNLITVNGATDPGEHQTNGNRGALADQTRNIEAKSGQPAETTTQDPMQWMRNLQLTQDEIEDLCDPEFIIPKLIIATHITAFCGKPGAGKTTLMMWLSAHMAAKGYTVWYFNYDIGSGDAKREDRLAREGGFHLMAPDLKPAGQNMTAAEVMGNLSAMLSNPDVDLSEQVFVFDTMKKFVDTLQKRDMKEKMVIWRRLTARNATVILLCHANKYDGEDGFPVFEGVGDLRSDADNLLYMIPRENEDGTQTVSIQKGDTGKKRGPIEDLSYRFDCDRNVTEVGFVDTREANVMDVKAAADETYIEYVIAALKAGVCTKVGIVEHVSKSSASGQVVGRRTTERVLRTYGQPGPHQKWHSQKGFQNNSWNYSLTEFG